MQIIISPAKKMACRTDLLEPAGQPAFWERSKVLRDYINGLDFDEQKKLWGCNEKIARESAERFRAMTLDQGDTPAVLAYEGIQYQYMAPEVLETSALAYLQEHLVILSGLYGALRPLDGVEPYRLEMQAKARAEGCRDLYEFWGDTLYQYTRDESRTWINLASKEYSKCIEKYLQPEDTFLTIQFGEYLEGKVVQKGVYAKMARGEMVRFLGERQVKDPEEIREFSGGGYRFAPGLSTPDKYVFLMEKSHREKG